MGEEEILLINTFVRIPDLSRASSRLLSLFAQDKTNSDADESVYVLSDFTPLVKPFNCLGEYADNRPIASILTTTAGTSAPKPCSNIN